MPKRMQKVGAGKGSRQGRGERREGKVAGSKNVMEERERRGERRRRDERRGPDPVLVPMRKSKVKARKSKWGGGRRKGH